MIAPADEEEGGWTYDPLVDPLGAEHLADLLAERATEFAPSIIVAWDTVESAILGYLVASRLGLPILRVFDSEGLLRSSGPPHDGATGVLVADVFKGTRLIRAASQLLSQSNGRLAAAISLVASPDQGKRDGAIVLISLVDPSDREASGS